VTFVNGGKRAEGGVAVINEGAEEATHIKRFTDNEVQI